MLKGPDAGSAPGATGKKLQQAPAGVRLHVLEIGDGFILSGARSMDRLIRRLNFGAFRRREDALIDEGLLHYADCKTAGVDQSVADRDREHPSRE